MKQLEMDSKVPLLSPFKYECILERQRLFYVSIGALSEPESCEEKIDCLNNCDRAYGIMWLGISPKIHHLIDSAELSL